jgi:hypothetical protein
VDLTLLCYTDKTALTAGCKNLTCLYEVGPKSNENDYLFIYFVNIHAITVYSFQVGSLRSNTAIPALLPLFIVVEEVFT